MKRQDCTNLGGKKMSKVFGYPEYDEKDIISEAVSVCDNCLVAGEGETYEV